jgi:peptidoglycan/LPS O-acetylase OafA/YrhL
MSNNRIYYPNLNGLRFIAALTVLIYHVYGVEVLNGHFGVILFFVLSGFLITSLLINETEVTGSVNIRYFIIRRTLRIWPLYFLMLLISTVYVTLNPGLFDLSEHLVRLKYYVTFLPNWAMVTEETIPLAGILWSVGSEEQFYLLWPFVLRFGHRRLWAWLVLIVIIYTMCPILMDYYNANIAAQKVAGLELASKFMLRMAFNCMATGGLVAYLWHHWPKVLSICFGKVFQTLLYLLLGYLWLGNRHFSGVDQAFAMVFALIIANLALNPKSIVKLESGWLNYLGKVSYGIYVYHLAVFALLHWVTVTIFGHTISSHVHFVLGTALTICTAGLSYRYFEKYFLDLKTKKYQVA